MTAQRHAKGAILVPCDRQYPDGALVVDGYETGGSLLAHPLGGGFQFTITPAEAARLRPVGGGEQQSPLYRKAKFSVEGLDGEFEGWTDGTTWNGWAKPRFELAAARLLARVFEGTFDEQRDCFITKSGDGEDEIWAAEIISILGGTLLKVYPIGAGAWIWDEIKSSAVAP